MSRTKTIPAALGAAMREDWQAKEAVAQALRALAEAKERALKARAELRRILRGGAK
jgi:sirohydrochlorin ferrochelatase